MRKRVFKRTFFIILIFLFILLLIPTNFSFSFGEEKNDNNYFGAIRKSHYDGRFEMGLEVGIDYDGLHLEENEVSTFKSRLQSVFNEFLEQEKSYINLKYSQSEDKKYSPDEDIVFGEIECGNNFLYFGITFSSIDAYMYYYSDVSIEVNEGFLISNTIIDISNPFLEKQSDLELKKDYYLDKIYSLGKGLSIEQSIKNDYKPRMMFDFISRRDNYISNCEGVYIDSEGYYHYAWGRGKDFTNMTLKLNIANRGWWYLLGLTIPLAGMGIALVVIFVKKKMDNNKGKKQ